MATTGVTADRPADDGRGGVLRRVTGAHEFGILVATIVVFAFCAVFADHFLTASNLLGIVGHVAVLGIIATGMTYVIISGEVDLSVGSMHSLLAVALAWMVTQVGIPVGTSAPLILAVGAGLGAFNGLLTTRLRIPSFIVTLAGLSIFSGAALVLSDGSPVAGSAIPAFRNLFAGFPAPNLQAQALWMVAVMALGGWVLAKTKFGYDVYATGGNTRAAAGAGINTDRVKVLSFALTGALVALTSVIVVAWLGSGAPSYGDGLELEVIAAVIIGGASLFGGKGTVLGTFLGAILTGIIRNALVLFGIDQNWVQIAIGALILVAVLVNTLVARRMDASSVNPRELAP